MTATRIGDAVLSTGLLRHLLERFPDARFTIVAGPLAAPLFAAVPGLEKLIALAKRRHARHWLDLYRQVFRHSWDLVVDLRGSALAWLLRAKVRRVASKGERSLHRVELLGRLFGLVPPPAPVIRVDAAHEQAAMRLLGDDPRPILVVAPVASWGGKQWRAERFNELIGRLTSEGPLEGARIAVVSAPNERAQAAPVLDAIPEGRAIDLIDTGDLLTVAAAIGRARLFIGNDSGLMHMAAAMDVPTLGLFGPSPVQHYAPWGPRAAVAATTIPYETLVAAPAFDYRSGATQMDSLSVDAAEAVARDLIARTEARP